MATRTQKGIALFKQAWPLLQQHKRLFALAFIAHGIAWTAIGLLLIPLHRLMNSPALTNIQWHHFIVWYLVLLFTYFLMHLITFYFMSVLVFCSRQHFNAKPIAVLSALKEAACNLWYLYLWASFMTTLGIFLALFQPFFGNHYVYKQWMQKQYWLVATYLIIPVLLVEKKNPISALKRSSLLITEKWGSPAMTNFGFGGIVFGCRVIALIPLVIGAAIGGIHAIAVGGMVTVLFNLIITTVSVSVHTLIRSALYYYLAEGQVGRDYESASLEDAFKRFRTSR